MLIIRNKNFVYLTYIQLKQYYNIDKITSSKKVLVIFYHKHDNKCDKNQLPV